MVERHVAGGMKYVYVCMCCSSHVSPAHDTRVDVCMCMTVDGRHVHFGLVSQKKNSSAVKDFLWSVILLSHLSLSSAGSAGRVTTGA